MTSASPSRLVFTGRQQVSLESFTLPELKPAEVRLRIERTLMSTGTENIVFNRHFDPGTHWDRWVKYPFYPGYTAVGVVEAVGSEVTALQPGDRVASRTGHASAVNAKASECFPIPAVLDWDEAVWFSLAKIAFHGASVARYTLGDSVLIIGAGPIGQMSTRWARAAGCASIIVADAVPDRMALASAGGASATIVGPIAEAKDAVVAACGGHLPRVVIDSTGNAAVFSAALSLAADRGTVVVLGDTGQPGSQTLTSDVIMRGLTIVGAHDGHNTTAWNNQSITELFFTLAATGRFPLDGLNTHRFTPAQCEEAYAVANRARARTMGIVFDWSAR
ncbi:zinc-dependent alcohol dehydrogenase [Terrimicrobium sacchariphilum]|nr:zinc-binding alcohol dehydrogenase [Terrimicrobium sacchariphilum]